MTRTHYQQIERGLWKPEQPANPSIKVLAFLAHELQIQIGDLVPLVDKIERDS